MNEKQKMREDTIEQIKMAIIKNGGLIKTAQLYEFNLDYRKIQSLVDEGVIQRVKNGYYGNSFEKKSEESIIAGLFPDAVLCLDSALFYHNYIENRPYCWHLAIDKNTSKSRFKLEYPLIQAYYTEPEVLLMGTESMKLGEGSLRIYNKERLICDCLKFENKLERGTLQQAIMAYIKEPEKDIQKLMEYARARKVILKVQNRIGAWL
ncbi:hypothetical protein LQZ18_14610 [Lachnospiraceae bacterium ZAX-1]